MVSNTKIFHFETSVCIFIAKRFHFFLIKWEGTYNGHKPTFFQSYGRFFSLWITKLITIKDFQNFFWTMSEDEYGGSHPYGLIGLPPYGLLDFRYEIWWHVFLVLSVEEKHYLGFKRNATWHSATGPLPLSHSSFLPPLRF